jgi:hypothetical protein
MAKTLQEMLESDLGMDKTASAVQPADGMDKLAMELGLFGEITKTAEPVEHKEGEGDGKPMDGEKKEEKEEKGEKKEASLGLDDIYGQLFPEDAGVAVVKTAAEVKEASVEEAVGAEAYNFYRQQMDNRTEKLAMDILQGKFAAEATADGDATADPTDKVKVPNNRAGTGPINTTPQAQGDLGATNGPADIGAEKMVTIKAASADQQSLMTEMFTRGQEMGLAIADQMDKLAAETEKVAAVESTLDEEGTKLAAVCGAFIERGQFEKLAELGVERHQDSLHYFYPYVEEKVAEIGAVKAVKAFGEKASKHISAAGGKVKDVAQAAAAKGKEHPVATHALAAAGGYGAGRGIGALIGKMKKKPEEAK